MIDACFGKSCLFSLDTESYVLIERPQALGSNSETKAIFFSDIDASAPRIGQFCAGVCSFVKGRCINV